MKPIRLKILNKRVTIVSIGNTIGSTGSVSGGDTTVYSNLPIRITKAKGDNNVKDLGISASSNYLGFIQCELTINNVVTTIVIKTGYIVIDGSVRYKVDYVDSAPGGLEGHHQELYMSTLGK